MRDAGMRDAGLDGGARTDGGEADGGAAAMSDEDGCDCAVPGAASARDGRASLGALLVLGWLLARVRRRVAHR
jgi:MYXO-CTERM domain-containing protein